MRTPELARAGTAPGQTPPAVPGPAEVEQSGEEAEATPRERDLGGAGGGW